jgi:putative oxidoreductase
MQIHSASKLYALYLRIAIAVAYLLEVADRLGLIGSHGQPHVGWGDWGHFVAYPRQVIPFVPAGWVPALAIVATLGESAFGLLMLPGLFTRYAAIGSGLLSLCFALAIPISFGIDSPLGYSVFTLSAASFLLSTLPHYAYSIDNWLFKTNQLFTPTQNQIS